MKRLFLLIALAAFVAINADAQKLAMNASTKTYGYKNNEGAWMIAPQFQYAFEFQGHFKRFAVVKIDRFWGCIDNRGKMIVRNIFFTSDEAEQAG